MKTIQQTAILFILLCGTAPAVCGELESDLLNVISKNDITFYGESHSLRDARKTLISTLDKGFKSGTIDAFATEYVLDGLESDFQAYLSNPNATAGSAAEKEFFDKAAATGFVWMKEDLNKNFFRFLRQAKQANPKLKICGLDVPDSQDVSVRRKRFDSMNPVLRKKAEGAFRLSVNEMVEASDQNYDREPLMAQRTVNCLGDSKHAVVHIGYNHAYSPRLDSNKYESEEDKKKPGWLAVTGFVHELRPNAKIATVITAQPTRAKGKDFNGYDKIFAKASKLVHDDCPTLHSSTELPSQIKSILKIVQESGPSIPMTEVWDYFILGPEGERAPLWDQHE